MCCAAPAAQQALRYLPTEPIDLVVLDWMIPKEEGRDEFRADSRGSADVTDPVVHGAGANGPGRRVVERGGGRDAA